MVHARRSRRRPGAAAATAPAGSGRSGGCRPGRPCGTAGWVAACTTTSASASTVRTPSPVVRSKPVRRLAATARTWLGPEPGHHLAAQAAAAPGDDDVHGTSLSRRCRGGSAAGCLGHVHPGALRRLGGRRPRPADQPHRGRPGHLDRGRPAGQHAAADLRAGRGRARSAARPPRPQQPAVVHAGPGRGAGDPARAPRRTSPRPGTRPRPGTAGWSRPGTTPSPTSTATWSIHDDPAWVESHVRRLTDRHEAAEPHPWSVDDAPDRFVRGQLRAIVGLELRISRVEAKLKLSQNRADDDIEGVVAGLRDRGDHSQSRTPSSAPAATGKLSRRRQGQSRRNSTTTGVSTSGSATCSWPART